MNEFECYVVTAWKHGARPLGASRFINFPDEDDRKQVADKFQADYVTIEKRYEYDELPFEG